MHGHKIHVSTLDRFICFGKLDYLLTLLLTVKLNVMGKGSTTHTHKHRHTLSSLLCADLSVKTVQRYIQSLPVGKKQ